MASARNAAIAGSSARTLGYKPMIPLSVVAPSAADYSRTCSKGAKLFRPAASVAAVGCIWLPLAVIVGATGFAAARACWQHGHDLAGITITGLLGALLSPVAWIHHLCWVVVAIGVIAGDGRKARRVVLAAATALLFLTSLPIWAEHTLPSNLLRSLPGFMLENSLGLWALTLIPVLLCVGVSGSRHCPPALAATGVSNAMRSHAPRWPVLRFLTARSRAPVRDLLSREC